MTNSQNQTSTFNKWVSRSQCEGILLSTVLSFPFALVICLYLLKIMFRSTLLSIGLFFATWFLLSMVFYLLIIPSINRRITGIKNNILFIWMVFEGIAASCILALTIISLPVPAVDDLTLSQLNQGRIDLVEVRIDDQIQPAGLITLQGSAFASNNRFVLENTDGFIKIQIPRPKSVQQKLKIIVETGPNAALLNIHYGRNNQQVNLREENYGETTIELPTVLPWDQVRTLFYLLDTCALAVFLWLLAIFLFNSKEQFPVEIEPQGFMKSFLQWWNKSVHLIIPPLAFYTFLPAFVAFVFPVELEMRESTKWLHALALQAGVNIYDNTETAFINMSHGPMDALIKSFLLDIFHSPFIQRWAVLVFPFVSFLCTYFILPRSASRRFEHSIILAICLELILISNNGVILIGQTETSAVVFLLLSLFLCEFSFRYKRFIPGFGFLIGLLFMFTFLSNWRYGPTLFAVFLLFFIRIQITGSKIRKGIFPLFMVLAGGISIFLIILYKYFIFDIVLYYQHFFGFYKDLGEKLFFRDFILGQLSNNLFVFISLLVYLFFQIIHEPDKNCRVELCAWTSGIIFIYLTTALAFYLNGAGGGNHYHYPFIIFSFFLLLRYYDKLPIPNQWITPIAIFIMFFSNMAKAPISPLIGMKDKWESASNTRKLLRELNKSYSLWSEDIHLYKDKWTGEVVDMGDYDSFYRDSGIFPVEFNNLVDKHFNRLSTTPPDAAIISDASSPELRRFIAENSYREIYHYSGWDNTNFGIWMKTDINDKNLDLDQ